MDEWLHIIDRIYSYHPWLWYSLMACIGLIVGSFINVVIHRLPIMLEQQWKAASADLLGLPAAEPIMFNLTLPASACPGCGSAIIWYDNIPLLSWLMLAGKCRHCHCSISVRYPFVELLTALVTAFLSWRFEPNSILIGTILFSWLLITVAFIDFEKMLLPDDLTLLLVWSGLFFNLLTQFVALQDAVIGAMAGYLSLWSVYWLFKLLTGKEGMGYGDFKLLAGIGAWLGWSSLISVVLVASLLGIIFTLLLIWRKNLSVEKPIPFGVYLALSGWILLIYPDVIMQAL